MSSKFNFAFSNNRYNDLVNLISDALLANHKNLKDMYRSKKFLASLRMSYEKIDVW